MDALHVGWAAPLACCGLALRGSLGLAGLHRHLRQPFILWLARLAAVIAILRRLGGLAPADHLATSGLELLQRFLVLGHGLFKGVLVLLLVLLAQRLEQLSGLLGNVRDLMACRQRSLDLLPLLCQEPAVGPSGGLFRLIRGRLGTRLLAALAFASHLAAFGLELFQRFLVLCHCLFKRALVLRLVVLAQRLEQLPSLLGNVCDLVARGQGCLDLLPLLRQEATVGAACGFLRLLCGHG
mmetsp:Transcript_98828/g.255440  ORF Transcript_98828/g.255440 Transcript_98828/m.255440 type:complete len:239 (-) Transcript_98828:62-778(-)